MGIDRKDFMLDYGEFPCGKQNTICDVPGVLVGHRTLGEGDVQTGVTAILPGAGNLFRQKMPAAVHVVNGFGKTVGTVQIEEMGALETPILLTNTFGVGTASNALIRYMLSQDEEIGKDVPTVNPVVLECNDGYLNDIRKMAVSEEDCLKAIEEASAACREGSVGAGRGMTCFGLKGGIGSASRVIELGGVSYTLGVLVLTNFGKLKDFLFYGERVGESLAAMLEMQDQQPEKGSIIVIAATDLPLSCRQLKRVAKRAQTGISRTGGFCGNGSGEIALAFSTACTMPEESDEPLVQASFLQEKYMDQVFRAMTFATEEAIVSSLLHSKTVRGRDGHVRKNFWNVLQGES